MIDLSQTVKTRIQSDSRTFRAKITIGQTDYTDLREFYVSSGTEAGGSISIGSTYSTRLSVKLANVARNTIVQGTKITAHVGVKIDDDLETFDDINDPTVYSWFQIGEFYISEAEPQDEDVVITAYDGFYLTQTLYDTEYTSSTTVANLISEIATNCNFQYVSDSIMNVNYDPAVLTGLTYREVIGYLASFVGTNAVFDELGRLKFVWYSDISRTLDEDRIASPLQLGDYTYTLGTLECVVATKTLDEEGIEQTTTTKMTSGTLGKTISFPQLYMTQAQLDTIRTRMLGDGFSVRAADIVWNMAEPDIQAGDIVTLEDGNDTFTIPVMRMQLYIDGGCYGNITSLYEADTDVSSTFEGSIAIAVERQYEELATFKKVVANIIVAERIRTQQLIADDIQAAEISATQITSGSLNTDEITITSDDGNMILEGNTQTFKDANGNTRIVLGQDANGNYTLKIYDASGNLLMDETGVKTQAIPQSIKDDVSSAVSDASDAIEAVNDIQDAIENGDFDGEDATVLRIDSTRGLMFKNNNVSTVLNVTIYSGPDVITTYSALTARYGASAYLQWYWQRIGETTFYEILSTDTRLSNNGFSLTLTPSDVDTKVTFMCKLMV